MIVLATLLPFASACRTVGSYTADGIKGTVYYGAPVVAGYGLYRAGRWVSSDDHSRGFKVGRAVTLGALGYAAATYVIFGKPGSTSFPQLRIDASDSLTLKRHAIFVSRGSRPVFGNADREVELTPEQYDAYISDLLAALRSSGRHTLMIRIHGGLNELNAAPRRVKDFLEVFEADTSTAREVYPLMINWQSSLRSTYRTHLLNTIQESPHDSGLTKVTKVGFNKSVGILYQFTNDVVRGALNAPFPLVSSANTNRRYRTDLHSALNDEIVHPPPSASDTVSDLIDTMRVMNLSDGRMHHGIGRYYATINTVPLGKRLGHYWANALDGPTGMVSPVFAPLVSTFAQPAWGQMRVRARELFRDGGDVGSDAARQSGRYREPQGAVGQLMNALQACFAEAGHRGRCMNDGDWAHGIDSVIVVGHSMGAIVATELVQRYSLPYSDVVFMAAASTVHDFESVMVPFLEKNRRARFYNLTLHPACEDREHYAFISPYGTLLTWLDNFLAVRETAVDGTFGRWRNAVRSAHTIPDSIADRVYLKAFGHYDLDERFGTFLKRDRSGEFVRKVTYGHYTPCTHGGFNNAALRAWDRDVWTP